jgi:hypothetical protein
VSARPDPEAFANCSSPETTDAVLGIDAPANTRELAGIDHDPIARAARARRPVQEARLSKRWCGTLWPTSALAQQAGMSDGDYAAFVTRALFLDGPEVRGSSASSGSERTRGSTAPRALSSSTRRSQVRSTSLSVARIPRRAARTRARSIGTSSAIYEAEAA